MRLVRLSSNTISPPKIATLLLDDITTPRMTPLLPGLTPRIASTTRRTGQPGGNPLLVHCRNPISWRRAIRRSLRPKMARTPRCLTIRRKRH